jgi:hypothetical protein
MVLVLICVEGHFLKEVLFEVLRLVVSEVVRAAEVLVLVKLHVFWRHFVFLDEIKGQRIDVPYMLIVEAALTILDSAIMVDGPRFIISNLEQFGDHISCILLNFQIKVANEDSSRLSDLWR